MLMGPLGRQFRVPAIISWEREWLPFDRWGHPEKKLHRVRDTLGATRLGRGGVRYPITTVMPFGEDVQNSSRGELDRRWNAAV